MVEVPDDMMATHTTASHTGYELTSARSPRWLSWLLGVALVIAISVAALRFSEAKEIAHIAEHAQPGWLLLALLLQLGTYVAQGEIWRAIGRATNFPLTRGNVLRLSLAKLFVDQALPSAGISGTTAVAKYFEDQGMAKPAVTAGVIVNLTSYFASYVLLLVLALLMLPLSGAARATVTLVASLFIAVSVALVVVMLALPGHGGGIMRCVTRVPRLKRLAQSFEGTDPELVRKPRLLLTTCAWQAAIMLLDSATVWVLIQALGASASGGAVFSSFMISNLFRTIGVLPGGLGTFEMSSVLTLRLAGVPLPVALSATLLFRGLSFWLPMIPGMLLSRRLLATAH